MPVNRCDQCHEYPGCCLCYGNPEPLHPDLEHLEEWDDEEPDPFAEDREWANNPTQIDVGYRRTRRSPCGVERDPVVQC